MLAVEAVNLAKSYYSSAGELPVLTNIEFSVGPGASLAIIGESGTGKSTLLNLLGGLDQITGGQLAIFGENIEKMNEESLAQFRNKHVGFVFQYHHLLPDFTALENVMIPALVAGSSHAEAMASALQLLEITGLAERVSHKPARLSGGEQQRVAIARALINKPGLMLLDEPTGNLDQKTGDKVTELIWRMQKELQLTILMVTHNLSIAAQAERCLQLSEGEGRFIQL